MGVSLKAISGVRDSLTQLLLAGSSLCWTQPQGRAQTQGRLRLSALGLWQPLHIACGQSHAGHLPGPQCVKGQDLPEDLIWVTWEPHMGKRIRRSFDHSHYHPRPRHNRCICRQGLGLLMGQGAPYKQGLTLPSYWKLPEGKRSVFFLGAPGLSPCSPVIGAQLSPLGWASPQGILGHFLSSVATPNPQTPVSATLPTP